LQTPPYCSSQVAKTGFAIKAIVKTKSRIVISLVSLFISLSKKITAYFGQ